MTSYVIGSDRSGKGDKQCLEKIASILEQNGHEVQVVGVNSNCEKDLMKGKDKTAVFICNGICIGTMDSCRIAAEKGGCEKVIFCWPKVLYGGHHHLPEGLKTEKIYISGDDNFTPADKRKELNGKYTVAEYCAEYSEHIGYAYGETCEDAAQSIMNGGEAGSSPSATSGGSSSIMSGWDSIIDLLKPLDGEAMVLVRGDTVMVKRITVPDSCALWISEGYNIVDDSVKISDYSPEIYNTFVVNWGDSFQHSFEISFDKHKELYGERKTEVDAVYDVPLDSESTDNSFDTGESEDKDEKSKDDDGGIFGFITNWFTGNDDMKKAMEEAKAATGEEVQTKQIPITDEAEAYLFGLKQIGKARRKDGHKVECKVIGNKHFEVGEWCKVNIPSFDENSIMFISKVSHDSGADSEWLCSLTLVDYPPSLSVGQSNIATPSTDDNDDDGGLFGFIK